MGSEAQTLALDTATFFPDSNIVHTGRPVSWTGAMNWTNNQAVNYSLTYTFGDGNGYVVSRVTGNVHSGSDTFRATHTYAASGTYTAKVVLKDAAGAAVDSLMRPFNVGSGYVVSGKFYYDCTQNCLPDPGELGAANAWIGIKIGQNQRRYFTDTDGVYHVAVPIGDTLRINTGAPDPAHTAIPTYCRNVPITATDRAVNVVVWLKDEMYMSDLYMHPYACKGGSAFLAVTTHDVGGGKPRIVVAYGDGHFTSYSYATNNFHDFNYAYAAPGDYTVSVYLYNTGYGGPYMRFKKTIHVDSCRKIVLEPVHDVNRNCIGDSGEVAPALTSLRVRSKFLGPSNRAMLNGGRLEYLHYTGDTATADTVLDLYTNTYYYDTVHLRRSCPGLTITDSTPDSLELPYGAHITLTGITPPFGTICYADTLRFKLTGQIVGYPAGRRFSLIADYGDGHIDTTSFTYSLDTFTLYPQHRYDTSGVRNCLFILLSDAGDSDTLRYQLTVNNCFPVSVRVFYDRNKNCTKDSGEAFALDYYLNTSTRTYYSDYTSGEVKVFQYGSADSVVSLSTHIAGFNRGFFSRTVTSAAGCSWPVMTAQNNQHLLPLVDKPSFIISYYSGTPFQPCSLTFGATMDISISGNYGSIYNLVYYPGNGLYSDTFELHAPYSNYLSIPVRTYDPGTYRPWYRVFDSSGKIVGGGMLNGFFIEDTCGGKGELFEDKDGDCSFSIGDVTLAGLPVTVSWGGGTATVLTDANGRFFRKLASTNDSAWVPAATGNGRVRSCGTAPAARLQAGQTLSFLYACGGGSDLGLLAAHHYFMSGGADTLLLYPSGYACDSGAGTLSVTLPAGISYTGADLPGGIVSGSGITWAIDTLRKLPPVIRIGLSVAPAPAASVMCIAASLYSAGRDADSANNDFYLCDSVRASIPDFYKSASSDSMYADGALLGGKEIVYSLRIRNRSAADTLQAILMYDTLNAALDRGTLHMLDASFPYSAQILAGGVLRIMNYGNIRIPPGDEAAVRFGVMPKQGLPQGHLIPNRMSVVLNSMPAGMSNTVYKRADRPSPDSVWPGDVNYDKIVDNLDALAIALAMGSSGHARATSSIAWAPQYCRDWTTTIPGYPTANRKHADCNGDGLVGFSDTLAVSVNYGLSHLKGSGVRTQKIAGLPDLRFDMTGIEFKAGSRVTIPIRMGDSASGVSKMAGIAARLLVDGASPAHALELSYGDSWLGGNGNTLSFAKPVDQSRMDWAYARTDARNSSGCGTLAQLSFTVPPGSEGQQLRLYFDQVVVVDSSGAIITDYNTVDDSALVMDSAAPLQAPVVNVIPNPSSGPCRAELSLPADGNYHLEVRDASGRILWQHSGFGKAGKQTVNLPTELLSAGLYLVTLHSEGQAATPVRWVKVQ